MTPYLSESRTLRLSALCILYVSQGLPDGFVRTGLKNYLIREGVSTAAIGAIIAAVGWPWAVKWIWGPVIDCFSGSPMGRRRPWIIAAQIAMACALAAMLLIPDAAQSTRLLVFAVLLVNCCSSMQDVAIDALAIDRLEAQERGVANGLMFGSADLGRFLGGAVVGGILLAHGLKPAILLEIGLLLAILTCPLFIRERRGDALFSASGRKRRDGENDARVRQPTLTELLGQLKTAFSRRSTLLAALLAGLSLTTTSAHLVFWPIHVQRQLGWESDAYVKLEGGYGIAFGLAGSLAGGVVASALGAKRSVYVALVGLAACWFCYAATAPLWRNAAVVATLFCAGAALANLYQVAMFALFMGVCRGPVAATQFSAFMALLNVSGSVGAVLAGTIGPTENLVPVFVGLGVFQLALIGVTACIDVGDGE